MLYKVKEVRKDHTRWRSKISANPYQTKAWVKSLGIDIEN